MGSIESPIAPITSGFELNVYYDQSEQERFEDTYNKKLAELTELVHVRDDKHQLLAVRPFYQA